MKFAGLPDTAVKESLDRVQSSLTTSGFSLPRTRVTINLAPADLKKEVVPLIYRLLFAYLHLQAGEH